MTDNIGEHMTDEELHDAQPGGDFKFNLADTVLKTNYRDVVVPNWMAADGRWGDVYNALQSARDGNFATATEKIVKAMEAARAYGDEEATKRWQEAVQMAKASQRSPDADEVLSPEQLALYGKAQVL